MKEKLTMIQQEASTAIAKAKTVKDLQQVRITYLGKKGPISELMKGMAALSAAERPQFGALVNEAKKAIELGMEEKLSDLEIAEMNQKLAQEKIDITLPATVIRQGSSHPLTRIIEEIEDMFVGMGFSIAEGPEVEKDHFNFEMLNLPIGHPAREMHDSLYLNPDTLLRTHTSPVQVRTMLANVEKQPIRIICPGKVYRRDDDDATHSHQFMQIEGLVVDKNITMADLKGTITYFAKKMFGEEREIRLRPSYFPFTEPSVEMDISCMFCGGKGCSVCKRTGWIEIMGAGMVHPNVLDMAGYDPKIYTGFAFGMGVERIAMLKYDINDIRHFYTNDSRFLKQFLREG